MNLNDKKIRLDVPGAWSRADAIMSPSAATAFPPLMYAWMPRRQPASTPFAVPLNDDVAQMLYATCRWGGCRPSRGEPGPFVPGWRESAPCSGPRRTRRGRRGGRHR